MTCREILEKGECSRFKLYKCDGDCDFGSSCKYADPVMGGCHAGGDGLMPSAILYGKTKPYTGLEVLFGCYRGDPYDCLGEHIGEHECVLK